MPKQIQRTAVVKRKERAKNTSSLSFGCELPSKAIIVNISISCPDFICTGKSELNMARAPTWAELRSDAIRLKKVQKICYRDFHRMLDSLPELDQKIESLRSFDKHQIDEVVEMDVPAEQKQPEDLDMLNKSYSVDEDLFQPEKFYPPEKSLHRAHRQQIEQSHQIERSQRREKPYFKEILDFIPKTKKVYKSHWQDQHYQDQHYQVEKPHQIEHPRRNKKRNNNIQLHQIEEPIDVDLMREDLEHLKPLPLPLSEYLKFNRPDIVMRADRRAMYLKRKAEKRKFIASTRTINTLDQIRSSRSSSNHSQHYTHPRIPRSQSHIYSVKCKLSEQEMKKLTARTYQRLPEVKSKRKEEISKHMRVQNYKNKLEYGRKLLENRRQGIINYPLRASYDDNSISSQDIFSMSSYERAADALSLDPYY